MIGSRLTVIYTNWRGETRSREITPKSLRFGSTEWHPDDQWLLKAYDHDKGEDREFALADCDFSSAGHGGLKEEWGAQ